MEPPMGADGKDVWNHRWTGMEKGCLVLFEDGCLWAGSGRYGEIDGMKSVNEQGCAGYAGLSEPRVTLRSTRGYDPSPLTGALGVCLPVPPGSVRLRRTAPGATIRHPFGVP
jgi:hypothetical protein